MTPEIVLAYLRNQGGKRFFELDAHFAPKNFRELDRLLNRLRVARRVRTVRNRQRYGDGFPRWEAA